MCEPIKKVELLGDVTSIEFFRSALGEWTNLLSCHPAFTAYETLHLELDPEALDYLIPNNGLIGFRFLVHETPEPLWVHHQTAVFLGTQFHTMLRLIGLRKVCLSTMKLCFLCFLCTQTTIIRKLEKLAHECKFHLGDRFYGF